MNFKPFIAVSIVVFALFLHGCDDDESDPSNLSEDSPDAAHHHDVNSDDDGDVDDHGDPDGWQPVNAAAWYTATSETLFQDTSATTPASADGDPLRRWNAESGPGSADATNSLSDGASSLTLDGGVRGVRISSSSGADAYLQSSNSDIARGVDEFTIFAVVNPRFETEEHDGYIWHASDGDQAHGNRLILRRFDGGWDWGGRLDDDRDYESVTTEALTVGAITALVGTVDFSDGTLSLYVNGALDATDAPFDDTGATDDSPSNVVGIGAYAEREGTQWFRQFEGDIHEIVLFQRVVTDDEIEEFFDHAEEFWGVQLDD